MSIYDCKLYQENKKRKKREQIEGGIRTLGHNFYVRVCSFILIWLIRGRIPTISIRARFKIKSSAYHGEATRTSDSGRAIVAQRSDMEETTRYCCRHGGGGGWLLMERWCRGTVSSVSSRSSSGSFIKVVSGGVRWVKELSMCMSSHAVVVIVCVSCRCVQVLVFVTIRCS
jgi:hypothetical protein